MRRLLGASLECITPKIIMTYDIFISYKRKSLPIANNLYYRLTTLGYSTFFDLEEMGRDNFNIQLLNYIENAKDVFVILEEGSLDACKNPDWEKDWFCREIAFALEKKKNIIPLLNDGFQMPSEDFFPDKLKELCFKNAPEFRYSYFNEYINKLIKKDYLLSKPNQEDKFTSIFKFYSSETCKIIKEGKLVCSLEGMSDEPYYLPVPRKGEYRFKAINNITNETQILNEVIDSIEEKNVEIKWDNHWFNVRNIFRNNQKGYSVIISIALLLVVVVIICVWSSYNQSYTKQPYSAEAIDSVCSPVDLGLPSGTLWGDRNLGATSPTDFGKLYAWGEITPIEDKINENNNRSITQINIRGTSYDVASIELGSNWELPSKEQFDELVSLCNWEWEKVDGHVGYSVTGPNRNVLFLPAAGCVLKEGHKYYNQFGYYWTGNSLGKQGSMAKVLIIGIGEINIENGKKYVGRSVRAVSSNNVHCHINGQSDEND